MFALFIEPYEMSQVSLLLQRHWAVAANFVAGNFGLFRCSPEVKASRNGPERRSGKIIIAGTAFRLEFLVGWYYDADATMVVPELY